jgi:uncharacterized protein YndB with AHSA1/START domain
MSPPINRHKFIPARLLLTVAIFSGLAVADVTDAGPGGFSLVHELTVDAPRGDVWNAAVNEVGRWWSNDHTISGDAGNMSIEPVLQGCFCEASDNRAGVVHLTVTSINPNAMLRLTGGLGPLGLMGVAGNMTWEFFDAEGGTNVRFMYAVGGFNPGGLDSLAEPVDFVIGEALQRLKAYVETGNAERANVD